MLHLYSLYVKICMCNIILMYIIYVLYPFTVLHMHMLYCAYTLHYILYYTILYYTHLFGFRSREEGQSGAAIQRASECYKERSTLA